jgi:multiple sugar transport system permease protein
MGNTGLVTHFQSEERYAALLTLFPALLFGGVFILWPIVFSLYVSMWDWPLIGSGQRFIGPENWARLIADRQFWHALSITVLYSIGSVLTGAVLSLLLALGLQQDLPGRGWLRTVFYLPIIMPSVAAALFWKGMFQPQIGAINVGLRALGLSTPPWLAHPMWALAALMIVRVWRYAGYHMAIFLAGLSRIPQALYEAAQLDGASVWARFWHVTWPLLRPTTALVLATSGIFAFQVFGTAYVLTGGGPMGGTPLC